MTHPALFVFHGAPTLALQTDRASRGTRPPATPPRRNPEAGVEPWAEEFDRWVAERLEALEIPALESYARLAPHAALAVPGIRSGRRRLRRIPVRGAVSAKLCVTDVKSRELRDQDSKLTADN
ncbi:MAG: hypothetical protein LC780_11795 [Acidobacteria bacterium]|nr:hypothetical protein [Acidobacteriota bacterium]